MKILHITESLGGGVYTYFRDLGEFIVANKYNNSYENILIYSPNRRELDKGKLQNELSTAYALKEVQMTREISPIRDLIAFYKLVKLIKKIKPNIIHLHSSKAGVLGRIAAIFYPKAKVFYTPHGYAFTRMDISNLKKKFYLNIEKYMIKFFGGTTIACGDTEYKYASDMGSAVLIRNGVRPIVINNENKERIEENSVTIGTIGRISAQKNPKLFNEIANFFPDINFIWIGDGELRNYLTSKNITVTGWIDRQDVLKTADSFKIYIQTSLWEGLPFTILEAMSLGKPIVATNVIGNKDAVSNEVNGYLCNDSSQFRKAITKIIKNKDLQNQFSLNSVERVNRDFNLKSNFKALFETYSSNETK